eukprot:3114824-Prymnesium_polylepis.1
MPRAQKAAWPCTHAPHAHAHKTACRPIPLSLTDVHTHAHLAPRAARTCPLMCVPTPTSRGAQVLQYVETLLGDDGSGQKLLLFAHHGAVLDRFEAHLAKKK